METRQGFSDSPLPVFLFPSFTPYPAFPSRFTGIKEDRVRVSVFIHGKRKNNRRKGMGKQLSGKNEVRTIK